MDDGCYYPGACRFKGKGVASGGRPLAEGFGCQSFAVSSDSAETGERERRKSVSVSLAAAVISLPCLLAVFAVLTAAVGGVSVLMPARTGVVLTILHGLAVEIVPLVLLILTLLVIRIMAHFEKPPFRCLV